jgi:hypothetical protein
LACALFKLPIGYLVMLTWSCVAGAMRRATPTRFNGAVVGPRRGERWLLLGPALVLGAVVSSQTGFGHHFRYAFPCLPFAFVLCSACFAAIQPRCVRCMAHVALIWAITSSLSSWPRCHSYFNELAHQMFDDPPLLESNLEWGEDLAMASNWLARHPLARPVYFAVMTDDLARRMPLAWQPALPRLSEGWYVVSLQRLLDPRDRYAFLRRQRPVAVLGASLRVYYLPRAAAKRQS